jgi:hypothetical protein
MKPLIAAFLCLMVANSAHPQGAVRGQSPGVLSALKTGDTIVVESKGGAVTYKAVVDSKQGGNITQICLPGDGEVIARELNDIFFHGDHGEQYTLRGWTGKSKFILSCSIDVISQAPDEVVVQVNTLTTGIFKVLEADAALNAQLRKTLVGYKEQTLKVKRTYSFKADRVVMRDELLWLYPDMDMTTVYLCAAFAPRSAQEPARLVKGATQASFYPVGSAGEKVPGGITYPFTAENFLKNGYKVSLRTTESSFAIAKSDKFFYEKAWQQDWFRLSGFKYNLTGSPRGRPVTLSNEAVFSKAGAAEMPPVVTIQSPVWEQRWMDEKGEVPPYKIGDVVKLSASAVNADGSMVPDEDISWDIHIDPWWHTPSAKLAGAHVSYQLPKVTNEEDKATAKDRPLLAVIRVTVKGRNGTEAAEPFAMLVAQ